MQTAPQDERWRSTTLTTWGRSRHAYTHALTPPESDAELAAALIGSRAPLIAYGAGRCYGDAALSDGANTLLSRGRDKIISVETDPPAVIADAGVCFRELSAVLHPRGLTYPVAAATAAVTLGGALANDIHGKNHLAAGSFGQHVHWFDLMLADGEVVRVDRSSDHELWRATIGGLGLTGIILRVKLSLQPLTAPAVDVTYRRMANLDAFLDALQPWPQSEPFWFGWIDTLADGEVMGRGILETGRIAPAADGMIPAPAGRSVPFDLPAILLHPQIIACFNARRFHKLPLSGVRVRKPIDPFYFPLDHIAGFNRVYGRRGFYSIHCGIPYGDRAALHILLGEVVRARAGSVAAVLKPMRGPGEGFISFPLKGYALAIDLPRRPGVEDLHARLEKIVLDRGGRLYAAKDALMSAEGFARMFPDIDRFRDVLRRVDPDGRFQSDMSRRLSIRPELAR